MEKLDEILAKEETRQENFDLKSRGVVVFYTGFGGGGFGGSDRGFGGGFSSSSPSSRGSGGFGSPRGSSLGSGGRRYLDDSRPDYMGGIRSKEPDYMGAGCRRPDPSGPLARAIEIKPIELPEIKLIETKPLELNLGVASPPSSFGTPRRSEATTRLLEAVTAGHSNPPSTLGSGGRDSGFGKDFGVGTGYTERLDLGASVKLIQRYRADDDNRIGQHLNIELFPDPIKPDRRGKIKPLINDHLIFPWKEEK